VNNIKKRIKEIGHDAVSSTLEEEDQIPAILVTEQQPSRRSLTTEGSKAVVNRFLPVARVKTNTARTVRAESEPEKISNTGKEEEFLAKLNKSDVAWIISGPNWISAGIETKFVEEVVKYHQQGGGLCLWSDNDPYHVHSNAITEKLFNAKVYGCDSCQKELKLGDPKIPEHFGRHIITTGITKLYEGHTVPYFDKTPDKLEVLATSSYKHAVILYGDEAKFASNEGRIIVDCGFTKLYINWDTAGTARYVRNLSVWLLGLDHRMKVGYPLKGKLSADEKKRKYNMAIQAW